MKYTVVLDVEQSTGLEMGRINCTLTVKFGHIVWCIKNKKVNMKNKADYSKYECPYSHLEKENGHELHGPEGYQDVYSVWCTCGFRAPVFYLDPDELGLKLKKDTDATTCA